MAYSIVIRCGLILFVKGQGWQRQIKQVIFYEKETKKPIHGIVSSTGQNDASFVHQKVKAELLLTHIAFCLKPPECSVLALVFLLLCC